MPFKIINDKFLDDLCFTFSLGKTDGFPGIKKVIISKPATIVIFEDGSKVVSKCHGDDTFDEQTGILICLLKKALGGSNRLNKLLKEANGKVVRDE